MLSKDKNGTSEWDAKLLDLAKKLEVSLYRDASTFDVYMDMSTLHQRLQEIATEIATRASHFGESVNTTSTNRSLRSSTMAGSSMSGRVSDRSGRWQTDRDLPHRRIILQHM